MVEIEGICWQTPCCCCVPRADNTSKSSPAHLVRADGPTPACPACPAAVPTFISSNLRAQPSRRSRARCIRPVRTIASHSSARPSAERRHLQRASWQRRSCLHGVAVASIRRRKRRARDKEGAARHATGGDCVPASLQHFEGLRRHLNSAIVRSGCACARLSDAAQQIGHACVTRCSTHCPQLKTPCMPCMHLPGVRRCRDL